MVKKLHFLFISLLFSFMALSTTAVHAVPIQLNEQLHFLRLYVPKSEADQAVISYMANSFMNHDIELKNFYSGQWIKLEVFDKSDKIPPFTQLPLKFTAHRENEGLFYITIQDAYRTDIVTGIKMLSKNKTLILDGGMDHEASLVIKASPNSSMAVAANVFKPGDLAPPPIMITEDEKEFVMKKTLYIQLILINK